LPPPKLPDSKLTVFVQDVGFAVIMIGELDVELGLKFILLQVHANAGAALNPKVTTDAINPMRIAIFLFMKLI